MIAMMTRPMVTPFRWAGHGIDVRGIVTENGPLFLAKDICEALEIEVEYESIPHSYPEQLVFKYPGKSITFETLGGAADSRFDQVYEVGEVFRVAYNNVTYVTDDFLFWFTEQVALLEQLDVDAFTDPEPGKSALANGATFSIARAARVLSGDPVISLGQQSLFEAMKNFGWISRDHETWIPADSELRAGHLVRHKQRVPGRKELYNQIRITHDGLVALHARLGGLARLNLDAPPDLTLVEI